MDSEVQELLDRLKAELAERGATTIYALGRTFRALDSYDGNRKVDAEEFLVGLRENGVEITKAESTKLLAYFDTDGDKCINIDEFLVGVRGELNETRKEVVLRAFQKFDKDGSGQVSIEDLLGVYSAEKHPKFISGEMSQEQIFDEFLAHIGDKNKDGIITQKEWLEYYAGNSASIDNDEHFVELIKNAWKLD